jgi:hypothetical protein
MHIKAVGANASLAVIAIFGDNSAFDRSVEIRVIEGNERRIAAQFQSKLQDMVGAQTHEDLADVGRSREGLGKNT